MSINSISVNGEVRPWVMQQTIADLVTSLGYEATAKGIAVAVNDEVVSRRFWATSALSAGDRIEVVVAVQGG